MTAPSPPLLLVARALFWASLGFALVMAFLPHPPQPLGQMQDKFQHMLAFGTLTILAVAAYPRAELLRVGERLSFVGALIEVVQSIPALHRDCDIWDWIADTVVIAAVLLVVVAWRRYRPKRR
jgi:hypothetical protein